MTDKPKNWMTPVPESSVRAIRPGEVVYVGAHDLGLHIARDAKQTLCDRDIYESARPNRLWAVTCRACVEEAARDPSALKGRARR